MFEEFLKPVQLSDFISEKISESQLGSCVSFNGNDLSEIDLAIIGVKEERGAVKNKGCSSGIDEVRKSFYQFFGGENKARIVDLGNLEAGATVEDTYAALSKITSELIGIKVIPIIIGGSHDLTFAQYTAYQNINKNTTLAVIDETVDLKILEGEEENKKFDAKSFLMKIIVHQPNFLLNISHIGHQSYFTEPRAVDVFDKMYFEAIRLGKVRENLSEMEPVLRDADLLSIDVSAIRQSDAPGKEGATPNGFYGEEMCQMVRYAGMSDKLSSIGFYEFNPKFDKQNQTAQLIAQMVWYFVDGFYQRKNDKPNFSDKDYVKYIVHDKVNGYELIFWKSNKSDRWWMQVPARNTTRNEKIFYTSCSYSDYQLACREEIPERWIKAYDRLG